MPQPLALDPNQVRALRLASQGLASPPGVPVATALENTGWVRTLGGCDAYLALRARHRAMRRFDIDTAIERGELQVVPAARGCMYLVPRRDVPLCLRFAESMSRPRSEREHVKAGIREGEVEALAEAVFAELQRRGPMTTDGLRKVLPTDAVRSLGDRGKKVGIASPLPPALRQLEFAGRIARTPEAHRLDNERYAWRVLARNALVGVAPPPEAAALHAQLLQRYVQFAGVATIAEFAAWSGLSQRDARAAAATAALLPATIGDTEAWTTAAAPMLLKMQGVVDNAAAFLPFEDNIVHLFASPAYLVDAAWHALPVPSWGSTKPTTLGAANHLALRGVVADGRLIGFWEFDPAARLAVPRCFQKPSKAAAAQIESISASVTAFLRDEIGHGRSFSLDTDEELQHRLALLRALDFGKGTATKTRAVRAAAARQPRTVPIPRTGRPPARPTTRKQR